MSRHIVCAAADLAPGERKIVTVAGREIGVFNIDGAYYAVRNRCPHQAGPLCRGIQTGAVSSPRPGVYEFDQRTTILRCPWHQWEFDITTGRSWCDPRRLRARAYPVAVTSGKELQRPSGKVPGPYTAETFPVSIEENYLVVDLRGHLDD